MGFFSKFENKMEDTFDNLGDKFFDAPISPVQIAKKAEKQMRRGKMVGAGKQYAPTLYTVLVNPSDDERLFGYYPTLAGETETYLKAKANETGLTMDGDPLVRFIVDKDLKHGKFDVIAEAVAADIVSQLRAEEMERYGVNQQPQAQPQVQQPMYQQAAPVPAPQNAPVQNDYDSTFADAPEQMSAQPEVQQAASVQQNVYQPQNFEQEASVSPAPQSAPVPEPRPAPMNTPAPEPFPAAQGMADSGVNNEALAGRETAVFAGGMNVAPQTNFASNNAVPPAHLRDVASGKVYTLNAASIVVGRENTCNIVLPDVNASRQHSQIVYTNGAWFLSDLGSTNGTYVNNQRINSRQIQSGDVITIGVTNLSFNVG